MREAILRAARAVCGPPDDNRYINVTSDSNSLADAIVLEFQFIISTNASTRPTTSELSLSVFLPSSIFQGNRNNKFERSCAFIVPCNAALCSNFVNLIKGYIGAT